MRSDSINSQQTTLKPSWGIRKWHEVSKVCLALALSILATGIILLSLSALPIEASCSFIGCGVLLLILIHIKKGSSDNSSTPISQGVQPNSLESKSPSRATTITESNSSSKSISTSESNSSSKSISTSESNSSSQSNSTVANSLPSSTSMPSPQAGATNERIIIGSGKITKRTFDLPDGLDLKTLNLHIFHLPVEYRIRQGDKNSIQTVIDDNINSRIFTRLEGSKLVLNCEMTDPSNTFVFHSATSSQPVQCEIILKTMFDKLDVMGPGKTHLTTFSGEKRNLRCSVPCIKPHNMHLEIEGQLGDLDLYLLGSATFSGERLNCDRADLQVYDHSKVINLNVSEKPDCRFYNDFAKTRGTGSCTYTLPGQPPTVLKAP